MRISNLILSCSIVAAIAVNLFAYEAGLSVDDNGEVSNVAVGFNTNATGSSNSTAIGAGANATASGTVSIGVTNASGVESLAIGYNTNSTGQYSAAIGAYANALADKSVALGFGAIANEGGVLSLGIDLQKDFFANNI